MIVKYHKIIPVFAVPALLLACSTLKTTGWQAIIDNRPLEKIVTYYQAAFADSDNGMVAGFAGQLFYTTDRAVTWKQAQNRSFELYALDLNGDYIWACGDKGNVRVSKDRGRHFEPVSDFGKTDREHCRYLSFLSPKTGWIASPVNLGRTEDGGTNWNRLTLPGDCGRIAAIDLFAEQQGVILDDKGVLFFTADQGNHWRRQDTSLKSVGLDLAAYDSPAIAMRFQDQEHGLIVARIKKPLSYLVLSTQNGGASFRQDIISRNDDYRQSSVYLSRDAAIITILNLTNQSVSVFAR
jgi:photosystem II stability/assembly factor-like uncharacterized protein